MMLRAGRYSGNPKLGTSEGPDDVFREPGCLAARRHLLVAGCVCFPHRRSNGILA